MTALPQGWTKTNLAELGDWGSGGTPRSRNSSFYGGGIPWVRSGDLPDGPIISHEVTITDQGYASSSAKWVPAGAILVAMYGATIGKLGLTTYPVTTNQAVAYCVPNAAVHPQYLFNLLLSKRTLLIEMGQGGAQPNISQELLKRVEVLLPPRAEQERIVSAIDIYSGHSKRARIELERIPRLVEQYKRSLLNTTVSRDLSKLAVASNRKSDWVHKRLQDLAVKIFDGPFGSHLKSKDYVASGVRVVRLENIGHLRFIGEKKTYISNVKYQTLTRHTLEPQDVLFSSFVDDRIRVCLFPADLQAAAINKADCFSIRADPKKCLPQYLAYRLASPMTFEVIKEMVHGATRPRITLSQLKNIALELPSLGVQQEIVGAIDESRKWLDEIMDEYSRSLGLLDSLEVNLLAKSCVGSLLPQEPSDEPATETLARAQNASAQSTNVKRRLGMRSRIKLLNPRERSAMTKSRFDEDVDGKPYLAGFLRTMGESATIEELFRHAQLPVTDFYKQLAWEVDKGHILGSGKRLEVA